MYESIPVPESASSHPLKTRNKWGWWVLLAFSAMVIYGLDWNGGGCRINEKARQLYASNNCHQVILSLQTYAAAHGGHYPFGTTSNEAFRELFKEAYTKDERIFTSPASPYLGDLDIGEAPAFSNALEAEENHWAMTKGLEASSPGNSPLVFENPAVATWPPQWDTRVEGQAKPGRPWKGGKVIVGRNDGSVAFEKLEDKHPLATLAPIKDGKNLFELAGPHEIMDVAR